MNVSRCIRTATGRHLITGPAPPEAQRVEEPVQCHADRGGPSGLGPSTASLRRLRWCCGAGKPTAVRHLLWARLLSVGLWGRRFILWIFTSQSRKLAGLDRNQASSSQGCEQTPKAGLPPPRAGPETSTLYVGQRSCLRLTRETFLILLPKYARI